MSNLSPMGKAYEPQGIEDAIYQTWLESGYFNPDNLPGERKEMFSIVLPPPNVTGTLHMGHATMLAIEDVMVRFARLAGKKTLWLPGTDHAAIATQSKVEKLIKEKENASRHDLGREPFLERVRAFAQESHDTIVNQCKKMGSSLDWSREAYTLDEVRNKAVNTAFKRMYDDGLIYRGNRVINWDPIGQTTIADDEIVYKEVEATLYTFKYSKDFPIAISTTRPETKVGDTAVAVHPEGKWKKFIGEEYKVEFCGARLTIKIVGDESVDENFGTGALGVTPAHSAIDAEIAQRHGLMMLQVINEEACMMPVTGIVSGMTTKDARVAVVDWLKKEGLLQKEEKVMQNLSTAERTGGIIEPLPKLQWFVDVNKEFNRDGKMVTLKSLMQEAVRSKSVEILPDRFEKTYFHWIDNLRDWCISRQIWFGHRIPVWYCEKCGNNPITDPVLGTEGVFVCPNDIHHPLKQDEDTLDTWFSSGLWTFSTLGWPIEGKMGFNESLVDLVKSGEKTLTYRLKDRGFVVGETIAVEDSQSGKLFGYVKIENISKKKIKDISCSEKGHEPYASTAELIRIQSTYYPEEKINEETEMHVYEFSYAEKSDFELYHPTSVLETGYDILFFWVARMILMSTYLVGEVPFKTVYLHGLVRDEQGRKMSKSLGNIIDPLTMIEKYGADATRLSLVIGGSPGNDMKLSEEKIAGFRNFTNKLWNISRFVIGGVSNVRHIDSVTPKTLADKWILSRFAEVTEKVTKMQESYDLSLAGEILRDFTWGEFADWYLEIAKAEGEKEEILLFILERLLIMWHPFMPFVTEEIYKQWSSGLIMVAAWPDAKTLASYRDKSAEKSFAEVQEIVVAIRNIRAQYKVDQKATVTVFVEMPFMTSLHNDVTMMEKMTRVTIESVENIPSEGVAKTVVGKMTIAMPLAGMVDFAKERERLTKEIATVEKFVMSLRGKLDNAEFTSRAPESVIIQEKQKLADAEARLDALKRELSTMAQ